MDKKIKTLMVASESDKIAKIGGLADVVYSLSRELVNKGTDVAVIIPYYGVIDKKRDISDNIVFFKNFSTSFGNEEWKIKLYCKTVDNVKFYLVQNDFFFGGDYGKVYIDSEKLKNGPFEDDSKRFAFFSKVVLDLLNGDKDFKDFNVIHCHDWHTSALILNLKLNKKYKGISKKKKILYTIHNLDYQGLRPFHDQNKAGMYSSFSAWFPALYEDVKNDKEVLDKILDKKTKTPCVNLMRAAINYADIVNTVSPSYMNEIMKPDDKKRNFVGGRNLEDDLINVFNRGALYGVLNGCDYKTHDPSFLDPPYNKTIYNWQDIKSAGKIKFIKNFKKIIEETIEDKNENPDLKNYQMIKKKLKKLENTDSWLDKPLILSVTRVVDQKVKILLEDYEDETVIDKILKKDIVFFVIGNGNLEEELEFINKYDNCFYFRAFNKKLADKLYSVCDLFLMPSDFEPCGISQMIAMAYGTIPIVNKIGGLNDTVTDMTNGFAYGGTNRESAKFNLITLIDKILYFYKNKELWRDIQNNALSTRFEWSKSADKYINLYDRALNS